MITGYNTDVSHRDLVMHVQTEDKGLESATIESLVYVGGMGLEDAFDVVDADDAPTEVLDDVEDGMVLDRGAHRDAAPAGDGSGDRHVVALGAAAGEDDLVGPATDDVSDDVARFVDRLARATREPVRARRVGVEAREIGHHRLERLGPERERLVWELEQAYDAFYLHQTDVDLVGDAARLWAKGVPAQRVDIDLDNLGQLNGNSGKPHEHLNDVLVLDGLFAAVRA